ncbi:MAG: twin-arginine translocation signal domain-containing protein, partial [Bacillota bacterium]
MDRRDFLKNSIVAAGTIACLGSLTRPASAQESAAPKKAVLKLSSQEGVCPGKNFAEKVALLEKWGAAAIELGAGFNPKEVNEVLKNSKLKVSAICAADGPYIVADTAQQRRAVDNAKRILDKAGEVGSTGVIMVPAFNGQKNQLWGGDA